MGKKSILFFVSDDEYFALKEVILRDKVKSMSALCKREVLKLVKPEAQNEKSNEGSVEAKSV